MTDEEIGKLTVISRSRTEPASRVERAQMLLAYGENPSFFLPQVKANRNTVRTYSSAFIMTYSPRR
jgi:hypothetical protein